MQPTHVYTLCSKNFLNHVPTLNHATLSPASSHLKADVPVLPHGGMGRAGRRLEVQRFYFIYAMIFFFPMAIGMGILSADDPCSVATSRKQPRHC